MNKKADLKFVILIIITLALIFILSYIFVKKALSVVNG